MKLYEITQDMKALHALVQDEELTAEDIADTLDGLECQFKDKALSALKVRRELEGHAETLNREIARISALRAISVRNAEGIAQYLKNNMEALGQDKIDLGLFKVMLKKSSKKLGQIDEDKVPSNYWETIPASKKLDKRSLLKDAKEESIEGVTLIDSERALIIK